MNPKIGFSGYWPVLRLVALIWVVLLFLFLIKLFWVLKSASKAAELSGISVNPEEELLLNNESYEINKEIDWLEQQLLLAKTDSLSLGINLHDSIVQVQLKGMVLISTRIIVQKPEMFLGDVSPSSYNTLFQKPAEIIFETANIQKKPVRKVSVKSTAYIQPVENFTEKTDEHFNWQFALHNNINVVVNGINCGKDSGSSVLIAKDILKINFKAALQKPVSGQYSPTLFLWLAENDAKAVYRALPENAKVLFFN